MRTIWTYRGAASFDAGSTGNCSVAAQLQPGYNNEWTLESVLDVRGMRLTHLRHSAHERRVAPRFRFFSPLTAGFWPWLSGLFRLASGEDMVVLKEPVKRGKGRVEEP